MTDDGPSPGREPGRIRAGRIWASRVFLPIEVRILGWLGTCVVVLFATAAVATGEPDQIVEILLGTRSPIRDDWQWLTVLIAVLGWLIVPAVIAIAVAGFVESRESRAPLRAEDVEKLLDDRLEALLDQYERRRGDGSTE
jgi:hypothetical protein